VTPQELATLRPRKRTLVLALVVSALIFVLLLLMEEREVLLTTLGDADITYIAFAVLADILVIVLVTWRWHVLLERQGVRVPFAPELDMVAGSIALNNVLPSGRIAGDLVRPILLEKGFGVRKRQGYASVFVDKAFDFGFAFLLTTVFLAYLAVSRGLVGWYVVAVSIVPLLVLVAVVRNLDLLEGIALGRLGREHREVVEDVFIELRTLLHDPSTLTVCVLCTILSIVFLTIRTWFILAGLGVENVGMVVCCMIAILETMLSSVPITPGGLGFVEGGLVTFTAVLDIARGPTFTVVDRFISYWLRTVFGLSLLGRFSNKWT